METDVALSAQDNDFRYEIRTWLAEHLIGEFADHRGVGSATDDEAWDVRIEWERELSRGGWLGLSWPREYGGRAATPAQEIIFAIEYAQAEAPAVVNVQALELLGPCMVLHGTEKQKQRFLPPILNVEEAWGQGWSEPGAGSDLASVRTRGELQDDEWVINGQKVWTTFGDHADWLYVLARTDPASERHRGLTMFLVPAHQPGVTIRPIKNIAGRGEFCETFLDGARTARDCVLGEVGQGWAAVTSTLGLERGAALLPLQLSFEREVQATIELARSRGSLSDPVMRQRLVDAWITVQLMQATNLRAVARVIQTGKTGPEAAVSKLFASTRHQRLGELEMELAGPAGQIVGSNYELDAIQKSFLLSRAETIYGGTEQIQRNVIAERILGLPR